MKRWSPLLIVVLAGCPEDQGQIVRVEPVISVCPEVDAAVERCDRPFDIGMLPITLAHDVSLFVVNRGDGPLVVTGVAGDELETEAMLPFTVPSGAVVPLPVRFTPSTLGASTMVVSIESDDAVRSPLAVVLNYVGIPRPVPRLELSATSIDFGVVRRAQQESAVLEVRNVGTAPLEIATVELDGAPTSAGEVQLASSTRSGTLSPGVAADVVVVYEPLDGLADEVALVITSNDPDQPTARIAITGTSNDDFPPIADARAVETGSTAVTVRVEELVALDGSASRDPEGDPLAYEWTLTIPDRSRAAFSDPSDGLVTFLPDVAGDYVAGLTVRDSLGQASATSTVAIHVTPRFAVRARLEWSGGGDLDLHFVSAAGTLFSADDCHFDVADCGFAEHRNDFEAPPGGEEVVMETAAPGRYAVYVHYFDDAGMGAAEADVAVVFDDASQPVYRGTMMLDATCALWHVGDVTAPPAVFTPSTMPLGMLCR